MRGPLKSDTRTRDVIVVGADSAGLFTALQIAEAGFDVVGLEEHGSVGHPSGGTRVASAQVNSLCRTPEYHRGGHSESAVVMPRGRPGGWVAGFGEPGEEIAVLDRGSFDRALAASVVDAARRWVGYAVQGARLP